jgi:hypothetical protein
MKATFQIDDPNVTTDDSAIDLNYDIPNIDDLTPVGYSSDPWQHVEVDRDFDLDLWLRQIRNRGL